MGKKFGVILVLIFGLIIAAWFLKDQLNKKNPIPRPMPNTRQKTNYEYYRIVDEKTGEVLTYISSNLSIKEMNISPAKIGVTNGKEDNDISIDKNRASYLRGFFGKIIIQRFLSPQTFNGKKYGFSFS